MSAALEWIRVALTAGTEIAGMVMEARRKGDARDTEVVIADMISRREAGQRRRDEADRRARERLGGRDDR